MKSEELNKYEIWREKLEYYCSFQERSVYDVELKIKKLNIPLSKSLALIKHLKENNFVNNERYAFALVRSKLESKRDGISKIQYFLKSKKIESSIIESALSQIDHEIYLNNLQKETELKLASLAKKYSGIELKSRLIRYLLGKGYKYDELKETINRLSKNN